MLGASLHEAKIDNTTKIDDKWRLAWEIVRLGIGAEKRNLKGVDLSDTILIWGNLQEANLEGANLSRAKLNRTNLRRANLRRATIVEADLGETDLREANLQAANMSRTDLRGANLSGAKYDNSTVWPESFNPIQAGAVFQN